MTSLRPLRLNLRTLYYGWWIVLALNAVAMITWGVGVFNQGVFLGYFVKEYGWSRADLSLGPTLFYFWAGLAGILVGRGIDRWGPRPVLIVGACAIGAGTIAVGATQTPWQTYPAWLLMGTGYTALHTVTLGAIISRWFRRDRARAMVAATFGGSVGGMILAPLNAAVLERFGALASGLTLAAVAVGLIVPLAIWVIKDDPEGMGLEVDGGPAIGANGDAVPIEADPDWSVSEALRTRAFWAIAVAFHLTMIAQGGFLIHQVLFLQPRFGFLTAAAIVGATTIAGGAGRFLFLLIGGRWSARRVASVIMVLEALGLTLSVLGEWDAVIILGSLLFGAVMGITVMFQPVLTAECFGRRSFGRVYGPIYAAIQFGTGLGPLLYGLLAEVTGTYRLVFLLVSGGLLIAAVAIHWASPPAPRLQPQPAGTAPRA